MQNYEHPDNLQTCKNTSIRLLQDTQLNCVFLSKIFNNLDCSRSVCLLHCVINTQNTEKTKKLGWNFTLATLITFVAESQKIDSTYFESSNELAFINIHVNSKKKQHSVEFFLRSGHWFIPWFGNNPEIIWAHNRKARYQTSLTWNMTG